MYQHHNWHDALLGYPMSEVVYVGGNYINHIKEMDGTSPEESVLFIKPETMLCDLRQPLVISSDMGPAHHEVELAALIGAILRQTTEEHVHKITTGYGVALGLTLHNIQDKVKKMGQPWGKTKDFDNSCPLSGFTPVAEFDDDPQNMMLGLVVNGE